MRRSISFTPRSILATTTARWLRTLARRRRSQVRIQCPAVPTMSYHLRSGETPADAAFKLLGDARLVNEIHVVNGVAYIDGEHLGPPAKWAAQPPRHESDQKGSR